MKISFIYPTNTWELGSNCLRCWSLPVRNLEVYDTENKDIYGDTFQLLHCGENERNVHCIRFVQLSVLTKCIRTISVFRRGKLKIL